MPVSWDMAEMGEEWGMEREAGAMEEAKSG